MSNEKDNKTLNQKLEEVQKSDFAELFAKRLKELVDNPLKTNPADGAERNETIMTYKGELNKTEKDYRNARQRVELRYGKLAIKRLDALANVLHLNPFDDGPDLLNMSDKKFDKFVEDLEKKIEDYRSKSTSKSDWIEQVTKHDVQG